MNTPSFIFHVLFCKTEQKKREGSLFATIITSICIEGKKMYKKAEDLELFYYIHISAQEWLSRKVHKLIGSDAVV